MADNVNRIAERLGAKVVAQTPDTGGGAFGATRLAQVVAAMQSGRTPARPLTTGPDEDHGTTGPRIGLLGTDPTGNNNR